MRKRVPNRSNFFRKNKFNAITCNVDGISFDSRLEASYYSRLKLMEKAGEITRFKKQVTFDLYAHSPLKDQIKVCAHRVDFLVEMPDGSQEVHEVKGFATDVWNLKHKMFEANYPDIPYRVIRK